MAAHVAHLFAHGSTRQNQTDTGVLSIGSGSTGPTICAVLRCCQTLVGRWLLFGTVNLTVSEVYESGRCRLVVVQQTSIKHGQIPNQRCFWHCNTPDVPGACSSLGTSRLSSDCYSNKIFRIVVLNSMSGCSRKCDVMHGGTLECFLCLCHNHSTNQILHTPRTNFFRLDEKIQNTTLSCLFDGSLTWLHDT